MTVQQSLVCLSNSQTSPNSCFWESEDYAIPINPSNKIFNNITNEINSNVTLNATTDRLKHKILLKTHSEDPNTILSFKIGDVAKADELCRKTLALRLREIKAALVKCVQYIKRHLKDC